LILCYESKNKMERRNSRYPAGADSRLDTK